jgi:hypothetical protein
VTFSPPRHSSITNHSWSSSLFLVFFRKIPKNFGRFEFRLLRSRNTRNSSSISSRFSAIVSKICRKKREREIAQPERSDCFIRSFPKVKSLALNRRSLNTLLQLVSLIKFNQIHRAKIEPTIERNINHEKNSERNMQIASPQTHTFTATLMPVTLSVREKRSKLNFTPRCATQMR